jgi:hypothetical protein
VIARAWLYFGNSLAFEISICAKIEMKALENIY